MVTEKSVQGSKPVLKAEREQHSNGGVVVKKVATAIVSKVQAGIREEDRQTAAVF